MNKSTQKKVEPTQEPEIHSHEQHEHSHEHTHNPSEAAHSHGHPEHTSHNTKRKQYGKILTVRALSGLSGDMMVCGLAHMANLNQKNINDMLELLELEQVKGSVVLETKSINAICGLHANVNLPYEHAHRNLEDIQKIIENSRLGQKAKKLALQTFHLLATAEAKVHGKDPKEVTFHEVGALDSIVDICLACAIFAFIAPSKFVCSPLPLADGSVYCAHGHIPTPAPAVLELLQDVAVCSFRGKGETITPTAIALLKTFNAEFDVWPSMVIEQRALVYGTKTFPNVANGAIWAYGKGFDM